MSESPSFLLETKKAHWDAERAACYIWFPKERERFNGWFHMRGGVCWPATVSAKHGNYYSGCLVMLGMNTETRKMMIFGMHEFQSVCNILAPGPSPKIRFEGISEFTNTCWSRWYAKTFYWQGSWETTRLRLMEVSRDATINPTPSFVEVIWDDNDQAILAVINADAIHELLTPQPECDRIVNAIRTQGEHLDTPAPEVWALACAINGLQNNPPDRL